MSQAEFIVLGRVTSVYGIKGWVKVVSETEPVQGILDYKSWLIKTNNRDWSPVNLIASKRHGKGLVVQFEGSTDRDIAMTYCGASIGVTKSSLPSLDEGDFYWHQLEGLRVITESESGSELLLGRVDHLMSTGSNDVLVVKSCDGSIDKRERLLPYLLDQFVKSVDLDKGEIRVDWDPEF